ncbi:MAG: hypothetical protein P1U34_07235 [Coxiellaceae bacterium]|nr:hypothetical protein [Coxiellaceae bacterium]
MNKSIIVMSSVITLSFSAAAYAGAACQLSQLPSELSFLITHNTDEVKAWATRDESDECDLRDYGSGHKYFRYWSWEERDNLSRSFWHKYCTANTNPQNQTRHWQHVTSWSATACSY